MISLSAAMSSDPIRLWPGNAPGALGTRDEDVPTITPVWPDPHTASGAAVIVCPGGGYNSLAEHEGIDYARWLNGQGLAAFVLRYRLGRDGYRHPSMWQDLTRAVRLVRARSKAWKLDPHRLGVMGSSAGGHLAATVLTHFDSGDPRAEDLTERVSSRPDFGVLCYPVITMVGEFAHDGSRRNLLGETPHPQLAEYLSTERQVTPDTPPCFLWTTGNDPVVPAANTLLFAEALARRGVSVELHVYENGPHGLGLDGDPKRPGIMLPWVSEFRRWLTARGLSR